jgi:antitoxin component YwqK of YwqJK toxin-antitoxin module
MKHNQKLRWANDGGVDGIVYEVPNDGLFQIKWPNGNLRYEWYYKDGKRADGVSKGWYENGQIKQVRNYKDNQLHGLMLHYYHNGLKKSEQNWKQNNLHGLYTMWYYARTSKIDIKYNKWKEGTYKDGIRDGKWTFWNPYGQVEREILYVPPYSSLHRAQE